MSGLPLLRKPYVCELQHANGMAHSLLVSETDGRVQFPRLVRRQSTRLAMTYHGLLQDLGCRYTVRAFAILSCPRVSDRSALVHCQGGYPIASR